MYDVDGKIKFEQEWILPMLTNLQVVWVGLNIIPFSPYRTRLTSGALKKMLMASRTTIEELVFQVWEHYGEFDMENLIAGVRFPKLTKMLIFVDWFDEDLERLKRFCERLYMVAPNLKTIEFRKIDVVDENGEPDLENSWREDVQANFQEWVIHFDFPKLPDLHVINS